MGRKVGTEWTNFVIYCNDRLAAMNIGNCAFALGYSGTVHREHDLGVGTVNMYKLDMYGDATPDMIAALRAKIDSYGSKVCSVNVKGR